MKTKISLIILGTGLLFTLACTKYPNETDRLLEDLAIITQYDTKIDFNDYQTFAIANNIVKITDRDTTYLTDANAQAILNQISTNMKARGFVEVVVPQIPDFGIQVLYFQNTYVYAYYYDYWGYYPYWYYYYPYYPVYYSSYTVGLADIELIDMKVVNAASQQLYIRWNAYIRGLMTGSHTLTDMLNSVDQAFIQTPQLQTSGK
jgi:hypothetical protein